MPTRIGLPPPNIEPQASQAAPPSPLIPPDPPAIDGPPVGGHTDEVFASTQKEVPPAEPMFYTKQSASIPSFRIRESLVVDGRHLPSIFIDNYAEDESIRLKQQMVYYEANTPRRQRHNFRKAVSTYGSKAIGVFLEKFPNTGNAIVATLPQDFSLSNRTLFYSIERALKAKLDTVDLEIATLEKVLAEATGTKQRSKIEATLAHSNKIRFFCLLTERNRSDTGVRFLYRRIKPEDYAAWLDWLVQWLSAPVPLRVPSGSPASDTELETGSFSFTHLDDKLSKLLLCSVYFPSYAEHEWQNAVQAHFGEKCEIIWLSELKARTDQNNSKYIASHLFKVEIVAKVFENALPKINVSHYGKGYQTHLLYTK